MRKKSPSLVIKSLEELISDYDRPQLARALDVLKSDLGWQILRAALMKEYLRVVPYALDLSSQTGKQIEASYQAGVAQCMFDTANTLIERYKQILEERVGVVETSREEE